MTVGRPFQKGNKMGKGRPRVPDELKAARKITRTEVEATLTRFVSMPFNEIKGIVERKEGTMLELMVASIISKGLATGDQQRLNFLLDRLVGKTPDRVESVQVNPFQNMTDEEKLEKARLAVQLLEDRVKK